MRRLLVLVVWLQFWLVGQVFASAPLHPPGVGGVADNIMSPVTLFSDMIYTGCIVIGISFLFASIVKYIEHRRSPMMVPMSTVVFLAIAGVLLLLLPAMSYVYSGAVKYSFFN